MKDKIKAELVLYRESLFENADDLLKEIGAQRVRPGDRSDIIRYLTEAHLEIAEALAELIEESEHQPVH